MFYYKHIEIFFIFLPKFVIPYCDFYPGKLTRMNNESVLKISYLASDSSANKLARAKEIITEISAGKAYELVSESAILFIATGGTEQKVLPLIEHYQAFILIAHREQNSWAAAMEIAAYLRDQNKKVLLIDALSDDAIQDFEEALKLKEAFDFLHQSKAAVVGEVSDWLIQSSISEALLKQKFGLQLQFIPWNELPHHSTYEVNDAFLNYFPNNQKQQLLGTSRVFQQLNNLINQKQLDAISVECFSLVNQDGVTACLPLAVLNAQGKVAACEGDIVSMIGKLIIKAISGIIPWQANIAEIKPTEILFAHCTAPLNLLKEFEITTHFETGKGTAIKGQLEAKKLAAFRLDNKLEKYMLIEGRVKSTPSHSFACRTQVILETSEENCDSLKNKALGNHHLLLPAIYAPILKKFMQLLDIKEYI